MALFRRPPEDLPSLEKRNSVVPADPGFRREIIDLLSGETTPGKRMTNP
jgi:hypothetical protein